MVRATDSAKKKGLPDPEKLLHRVYPDWGEAKILPGPMSWDELDSEKKAAQTDMYVKGYMANGEKVVNLPLEGWVRSWYDLNHGNRTFDDWRSRYPDYRLFSALCAELGLTMPKMKKILHEQGALSAKDLSYPTLKAIRGRWCVPTNNFYRYRRHWVWHPGHVAKMVEKWNSANPPPPARKSNVIPMWPVIEVTDGNMEIPDGYVVVGATNGVITKPVMIKANDPRLRQHGV